MNRINDIKDETIKTLARTLKESGLAASESEAIRMASNMAQTNKKANDTFEQRREKNIMGLSFLHKEQKEKTPTQEVQREVVYAQEPYANPVVSEEVDESCDSCVDCGHHGSESTVSELFMAETKDEFIEQDLLKEDEQPEKTMELPVDEQRSKKDLSKFKEAQVDLGDMFRFKG